MAIVISLVFNGCNRMVFEVDQIPELMAEAFPIDTVDNRHDWNLVRKRLINVVASVPGESRIEKVQILTGNPYQTAGTEILTEKNVRSGSYMSLYAEMPITLDLTSLWVAAISSSGKYYVTPYAGSGEVRFDGGNVISSGNLQKPTLQAFTYLFEEDFPLPGDFDFNDVVLRISKEHPASNIMKLHVTLVAVGADNMLGAAIRLPSIDYNDVESITIDEGKRFDEDYPVRRYYIDNNDIYSRGFDGSAVINLFDDAHWVINPETKNGRIMRIHYNTAKEEKENVSAKKPTQTRTYTIVVKEGKDLSNVTLESLDPFIIKNYNSANTEVHTFKYKYTQVLWMFYKGNVVDRDHMAWALLVPSSTFQYPVEGMPIGRYRNGENVGAYSRYGHSFGQWGRNMNTSQDWWLYPVSSLVY